MTSSKRFERRRSALDTKAPMFPRRAVHERLDRTVSLFDEILNLIDNDYESKPNDVRLSSEPLPSLLSQCEKICSKSTGNVPRLIVMFPGLPPLNPSWWRGQAPGLAFHRLPEPSDDEHGVRLSEAVVRTMQEDCSREGRELLFLATPVALSSAPSFDRSHTRLVVCHPWLAHKLGGPTMSYSLNQFCVELSAHLPKHEALRYEDIGNDWEERIEVLLERRPLHRPSTKCASKPIEYIGGSPAYESLCTRLGYDPCYVIEADWSCAPIVTAPVVTPPDGAAQVSWFLPRIAALLAPSKIIADAILPDIDSALSAQVVPEALDVLFSTLTGESRALAMILTAAHFTRKGENLLALGLVADALEEVPLHAQSLRTLCASLYLDMDKGSLALEALASGLRKPGLLGASGVAALDTILYQNPLKSTSSEHGHALLISYLQDTPPLPVPRKRLMVEIGTTRENTPGQGSTRKLAELCALLEFDFVTVDMDPSNRRGAQRMFKRLDLPFQAVTAKGEDYLLTHFGPIDYVFLDAYDFDHGNHSEQRQSRYERYLGERINEASCHQMHLDCARFLLRCLSEDGLICIDDTWIDAEGRWAAKGTTAVPFLLSNGFELIEARDNAALLRRRQN